MEVKTNKYKARIWDYHGHESNYEFEAPNDYEAYRRMIGKGFEYYSHDDCLWKVNDDGSVIEIDTKHIKTIK